MKRIVFLVLWFVSVGLFAQQIDTIEYEAGVTTHKDVRDKLNETVLQVNDLTDTMDLKLFITDSTSNGDYMPYYTADSLLNLKLVASDTTSLSSRIDAIVLDVDTLQTDTINIEDVAVMLEDYGIFPFGLGGGNAGDTASFTTNSKPGYFRNTTGDTLVAVSLDCVMEGDAGDTLGFNVYWDVNFCDGTPEFKLNTNPFPVNSLTTGNVDTSFANTKIPPDYWVWGVTPTIVAGKKPKLFVGNLTFYTKRTE